MFFNGGGAHFQANFGGGGGRRGGFRQPQQHQQHQRGHENGEQRQAGGFNSILQFLPIILMILMSFSSFSSNSNAPVFQLSPQGVYQRERTTHMNGISPDIKFYVNPAQFDTIYKPRSEQYRRVEKEVESEYKHFLGMKCGNEKTYRNNRMYQVSPVARFVL